MKAARGFLATAAGVLLIVMMVVGPVDRALADDDDTAEFGAGLTDIGPDATEALRLAFRDGAEKWLGDAQLLLSADQAAESDPKVWLDMCTEFSDTLESAVANAKTAAEAHLGDAWTGDLPKDWKGQIRDGRKFVLYMAEAGFKAYSEWADFAVWMKGYEADMNSMTGRIGEYRKDFEKLDKLISKASVTVAEGKKDAAKTLKGILKDVERLEQKTIPNDLDNVGKYRDLVEKRTKDAERDPSTVKDKLDKAAKAMDDTVKLCAGAFPATRGFAEEWARNGKELAEAYKTAYDDFVAAANPILGEKPPLWAGFTQFKEWRYGEFAAKLTDMRKKIQLEITRLEGVRMVD